MKDPKPRADGKCAREGCRRQVEITVNAKVPREHAHDPFCSSVCCRMYHGTLEEHGPATRKQKREWKKIREEGYVLVREGNEHVNRERHEGPHVAPRARLTGGG